MIAGGRSADDSVRQARDILARWSSDDLLDQISALPEIPPIPNRESVAAANTVQTPEPVEPTSKPNSDDASESLGKEQGSLAESRSPSTEPSVATPAEPVTKSEDVPSTESAHEDSKPEEPTDVEVPEAHGTRSDVDESTVLRPATPTASRPDIPAPKNSRRLQSRPPQDRVNLDRKQRMRSADEGKKPVSRKYRVDTPGQQPSEVTAEVQREPSSDEPKSNSPKGGRRYRIDDGEDVRETAATGDGRGRTQTRSRSRYIDEPHEAASMRGPHFQVKAPRRSNLTALTGQFLAYIGVLGLTVGTAMVIYGHFGGYSDYTPTGWLVTTAAQMLLFLGVINLVSGGIEQTNDDVSARISNLGEQLMRIEQVTEEVLRGPKISARRYADPDSAPAESEREIVHTRARD